MMKKSGNKHNNLFSKKTAAISIIFNLLLAIFAFSITLYNTSIVSADGTPGQTAPVKLNPYSGGSTPTSSGSQSTNVGKFTQDATIDGTSVSAGTKVVKVQNGGATNYYAQGAGPNGQDLDITNSINKNNELEVGNPANGGATLTLDNAGTTKYTSDIFGNLGTGTGGYALSNILSGFQTALFIVGGIQLLGGLFGLDSALTSSLSVSAFAGIMGYEAANTLLVGGDALFPNTIGGGILGSTGIGVAIGVIVFLATYSSTSEEKVTFECNLWQPPKGGEACEKCNVDGKNFPCNEYRCRSLGAACELLNKGTGEEKCTWINARDVESPTITPNYQNLSSGYQYSNVHIRPPGLGMEIKNLNNTNNEDGCIEAFFPITFGVTTNEPTSCKVDYNHTANFDDMGYYLGGSSTFKYNHTQTLSLPRPASNSSDTADPGIKNDGNYNLLIRCSDPNGNYNEDEFAIKFCVNKGPDTTPARIEATSLINEMPISFGTDKLNMTVYTNEPADCKWSNEDKDYNVMENTLTCSQSVTEFNTNMLYACKGQLTGIKDREENKFYFRCKDQPGRADNERNINQESYEFKVFGTQQLNIVRQGPNGTIMGSSSIVPVDLQVETANGYRDGEATCYYSTTNQEKDYVKFFDTGSFIHRQRQNLKAGTYDYYFKCVDLGGNADYNKTRIRVEIDEKAPIIIRAKHDSGESSVCGNSGCLQITTNEDSTCTYSTTTCNYEITNGIKMSDDNTRVHFVEWNTNYNYYIKCSDRSGNQPATTSCSMTVKAYNNK
ncbi:MAG: hypothetical protein AABW73_02935 [Nanoarchaeota archaeon]|mgnify:CR=1 FL=1